MQWAWMLINQLCGIIWKKHLWIRFRTRENHSEVRKIRIVKRRVDRHWLEIDRLKWICKRAKSWETMKRSLKMLKNLLFLKLLILSLLKMKRRKKISKRWKWKLKVCLIFRWMVLLVRIWKYNYLLILSKKLELLKKKPKKKKTLKKNQPKKKINKMKFPKKLKKKNLKI